MINRSILIVLGLFCSVSSCIALDTLYLEEFIHVIQSNHPLIKKANLFDEFTEAYDIKGRGALDPKIESDYQRKKFSNQDYYTVWQSEVKLPTRLPVDFSVGYENNDGLFLNNDFTVPRNGLIYGTINLSLLRGLLFDDQRYQMQMAELNGAKSQIEKVLLTREILFEAISSYLEWATAYYENKIYEEYFNLITDRHQDVISLFLNGDSPAIDTIESIVTLNTAEKSYLDSFDKLVSKAQKLSLFIWDENGVPLRMSSSVLPSELDDLLNHLTDISVIVDPYFYDDPSIRKLQNEIEALHMSNRLEREQLKPQLDIKYNAIVNLGKETFNPSLNLNDYKYGVSFQYPILNRKTRGELQLNEALIDQINYEKIQYEESLLNKYVELNQRQSLQQDIFEITSQKIDNSERLYLAEILKFQLGESSVFLLNQRELKLLEARIELNKSFLSIGKLLNQRYYLRLGQNL